MMTPEQLTGQSDSHLMHILVGQKDFLIHPEVCHDLLALKEAADGAGFNLNIASGFRSFERQLSIWNRKMSGDVPLLDENSQRLDVKHLSEQEKVMAILRWSALPGASRHHWGTDFDVFDRHSLPDGCHLKLEPWEYLHDHQYPFYAWLKENLTDFGFFFPYQENGSGVAFEPWHISHKKSAQQCSTELTLAVLAKQLEDAPILGKEYVQQSLVKIYNQYIVIKP